MDGKRTSYIFEQRVAADIDGGMSKPAAMAKFGIMSRAPLDRWCRFYRWGGAEALRPRPKGRPKESRPRSRTREKKLEERCRRIESEGDGIAQSMPRKGNCIDNAATEQLFSHIKNEFHRDRKRKTFENSKRDLRECIVHWNSRRR